MLAIASMIVWSFREIRFRSREEQLSPVGNNHKVAIARYVDWAALSGLVGRSEDCVFKVERGVMESHVSVTRPSRTGHPTSA